MRRIAAIALATLLVGCEDANDEQTAPLECAPADHRLLCGAPLLIAHRGGGELMPEETLSAFANAMALGADVLELDVHSTSDGHVVCLHDETVDRTTSGSGEVHDLTLDELRALDAGYHFSPDGVTFPWRGMGITVPTLREVLDAHPEGWWSVEIKQYEPSIVDDVVAELDRASATARAVVVSFSDDVVLEVRAKHPHVLTGMPVGEMLQLNAVTDETEGDYQPPTRIVQPPSSSVTPDLVARANRLGLRLHPWTVNDEAEMEQLLDLGAHGIMTDNPSLLAEVLSRR